MNKKQKCPKIVRTPEQKAEEKRIREMHRQNPIREVPSHTLKGAEVAELLAIAARMQRLE